MFPTIANPVRRFLVVGEPFYTYRGVRYSDLTLQEGEVVTSAARPDADGDLLVWRESGNVDEVSIEALVEIDAEGHPVLTPDFVLDGEDETDEIDDEILAALAPLAIVILGRDR